jgi:hypothetical protein
LALEPGIGDEQDGEGIQWPKQLAGWARAASRPAAGQRSSTPPPLPRSAMPRVGSSSGITPPGTPPPVVAPVAQPKQQQQAAAGGWQVVTSPQPRHNKPRGNQGVKSRIECVRACVPVRPCVVAMTYVAVSCLWKHCSSAVCMCVVALRRESANRARNIAHIYYEARNAFFQQAAAVSSRRWCYCW